MDTLQRLHLLENLILNIQGGIQICKFDDALTIVFVNHWLCNLIGYTCEEIETIFQNEYIRFLPKEQAELVKKGIREQLEIDDCFTVEHQMIKKDGSLIWVINKGALVQTEDGEVQIHCVLTDVTEQKKTLKELNRKKYEIEILTNNIEAAIVNCSLYEDWIVNYANSGLFRLSGYTRQEFKTECHNSLDKLVHPEDREALFQSTLRQFEETGTCKNVYRMIRRDGSIIWVLEQGARVENENGIIEFHGVLSNITQEEQNRQLLTRRNEELLLSQKRYSIAMENSEDIIFDYIIEKQEIVCSAATIEKFKNYCLLENTVNGLIQSGLIHPNSIANLRELFKKIDDGASFVSSQITGIVDGVKEVLIEISLTTVLSENGNPIRAIGVIRNIDEKRMLQSERKYRKAMTADKLYANELNITQDIIVATNPIWLKSVGIPHFVKVSQMIDYICVNLVHPDFQDDFRNFFDNDKITKAYCDGKTQSSIQYRRKDSQNVYLWVENTMSIICDDVTNDIKTRVYVKNINQQKEKEIKSFEEKRFYEAMLSDTVIVYEVNITQDLIIRGNEYWDSLFGFKHSKSYTDMITAALTKVIHPEDAHILKETLSRESALHGYAKGQTAVCFEYRRPDETGKYKWMSCDAHLFLDPISADLKAFAYLQDINEKKLEQLELFYKAEHDGLSGFYNKVTVERLIDTFLLSEEGQSGKHAFFIFDIDQFKKINDIFGHVFGDVILLRITQKIRDLYRDVDILGRIGGDEFVVLMKNIPSYKSAISKAHEICSVVRETYTKFETQYQISVSIGIAIYSVDGTTYGELYACSDAALYQAKAKGKNQFCLYNTELDSKVCDLEQIKEQDFVKSKSFEKNISEYVFRILYESSDKPTAINTVLGLIGQQYNISMAYIYENSGEGTFMKHTFGWYGQRSTDKHQELPLLLDNTYMEHFSDNGMFLLCDFDEISPELQRAVGRENTKLLLQFAIIQNGKYRGLIGFDQCNHFKHLSKEEMTDLRNVAHILGMFIVQMQMEKTNEKSRNIISALSTGLCKSSCIVD
ncbi:MAG: sensor domain-containing diguanylate cyclase [Oscillospiraceae bacterium]